MGGVDDDLSAEPPAPRLGVLSGGTEPPGRPPWLPPTEDDPTPDPDTETDDEP